MPYYSLLLARTFQHAENAAMVDWKWRQSNELRSEFVAPSGERVRYAQPNNGRSLQGLRWGTRVFLGPDWQARDDAGQIRYFLSSGFFIEVDPDTVSVRKTGRRLRSESRRKEEERELLEISRKSRRRAT